MHFSQASSFCKHSRTETVPADEWSDIITSDRSHTHWHGFRSGQPVRIVIP